MRPATDVSVVIPTYNYGRFVGRAIRSALDQTLPPAEVTVVDDGSTDDTVEVLRGFGSDIRVISQANKGVAAARNTGARSSRGSFLAFLDADDVWDPRMLEMTVAALGADADAGAAHSGLREVDEDGREVGLFLEGKGGRIGRDLLLMRPIIALGGSAVVMRRAVFDEVGGYDERLSTSADWELSLRVSLEHPILFVPEPLVSYTLHGSNMHRNLTAMEHDVVLGMEKALASHPELESLRAEAFSNLFMTLSGSYYAAGDRGQAVKCALRSLRFKPSRAIYALALPVRRMQRRAAG